MKRAYTNGILLDGTEQLDGFFGNDFHIRGQFLVVVCGRIIVDAAVHFFRHDTYLLEGGKPAGRDTSLADIAFSVAQVIVLQLVHVFLTDDVHFREVEFAFSLAEEFGFDERSGGKAPAGTGSCLIFDRSHFWVGDGSKLVAFGFRLCLKSGRSKK